MKLAGNTLFEIADRSTFVRRFWSIQIRIARLAGIMG